MLALTRKKTPALRAGRACSMVLGVAMAVAGGGCATEQERSEAGTLRVPVLPARAPRPVIYLWVDASERVRRYDREREQNVPMSREIREATIAKALRQKIVAEVLTDPLDAARADYRVLVKLDVTPFEAQKAQPWLDIESVYALGDDYLLPKLDDRDQAFRTRITIYDRQGRTVGLSTSPPGTTRDAARRETGSTTVGYQGAVEFIGVRLLALLSTSAVFRPAPPRPRPPVATPSRAGRPPAPAPASAPNPVSPSLAPTVGTP